MLLKDARAALLRSSEEQLSFLCVASLKCLWRFQGLCMKHSTLVIATEPRKGQAAFATRATKWCRKEQPLWVIALSLRLPQSTLGGLHGISPYVTCSSSVDSPRCRRRTAVACMRCNFTTPTHPPPSARCGCTKPPACSTCSDTACAE